MNELELCRLCANFADETNSEILFDKMQRNLLRQAEELIGLELINGVDLPQFICKPCHEQTLQSHEFRERCIRVQKHFAKAAAYKIKLKNQMLLKDKITYKIQVKEEAEEEDEEPLPPVEEVLIEKDEEDFKPIAVEINTYDSSSNDWNDIIMPMLDIDYHESLEENDRLEEADAIETNFEASPPSLLNSQTNNDDDLTTNTTTKHNAKRKRTRNARKTGEQDIKPKLDRRKYKPKQKFICEQCGRNFNCRSYFELHMSRHAGDKQFQCEVCPDKFFTKADLRRHTYKHTGERPIPCRFCDRRFIDHSLRTKHEKTHTNERPHACNECGKRFNQKQHLDCHMQLHTGERFFSCALCNTTFQRKSNMTAHFNTILHKQNLEKQQKLENITNNIAESADSIVAQEFLNVC